MRLSKVLGSAIYISLSFSTILEETPLNKFLSSFPNHTKIISKLSNHFMTTMKGTEPRNRNFVRSYVKYFFENELEKRNEMQEINLRVDSFNFSSIDLLIDELLLFKLFSHDYFNDLKSGNDTVNTLEIDWACLMFEELAFQYKFSNEKLSFSNVIYKNIVKGFENLFEGNLLVYRTDYDLNIIFNSMKSISDIFLPYISPYNADLDTNIVLLTNLKSKNVDKKACVNLLKKYRTNKQLPSEPQDEFTKTLSKRAISKIFENEDLKKTIFSSMLNLFLTVMAMYTLECEFHEEPKIPTNRSEIYYKLICDICVLEDLVLLILNIHKYAKGLNVEFTKDLVLMAAEINKKKQWKLDEDLYNPIHKISCYDIEAFISNILSNVVYVDSFKTEINDKLIKGNEKSVKTLLNELSSFLLLSRFKTNEDMPLKKDTLNDCLINLYTRTSKILCENQCIVNFLSFFNDKSELFNWGYADIVFARIFYSKEPVEMKYCIYLQKILIFLTVSDIILMSWYFIK
jgi:hypothetical protein